MSALTAPAAHAPDVESTTRSIAEIAAYLQDAIGQRSAAYMAGLSDARQIGRYSKPDGPAPSPLTDRRLREGYKVVRMLCDAYDATTARAWLFGTNTRLDDNAPIEVLAAAESTDEFASVIRAARQVASFQA